MPGMSFVRKTWWIWLISAGICIFGIGLYLVFVKNNSDPCLTETVEVLINRYPQLKDLKEKQQDETAKLLAMQRQQDLMVNLEMSSEQISPEQALRLSLGQIDQLAELRKRHSDEFKNLCHEVISKSR